MKNILKLAAASAFLALAACGGSGDDAMGDNVADAAEAQAENMEAMADNMSGPAAEGMEAQAEAVAEEGERKEEAIDDADVEAENMSPAQQNQVANAM